VGEIGLVYQFMAMMLGFFLRLLVFFFMHRMAFWKAFCNLPARAPFAPQQLFLLGDYFWPIQLLLVNITTTLSYSSSKTFLIGIKNSLLIKY
jgi:hypothetical protein